MHTISFLPVSIFSILTAFLVGLTFLTSYALPPIGIDQGVPYALAILVLFYLYAFAVYRAFLFFFPLPLNQDIPNTTFLPSDIYLLFFLIFFRPLIIINFIPIPLMRVIYQILGAKLGPGTYIGGALLDPPCTILGSSSIVGHNATLYAHVIEGPLLRYEPIVIGDHVTIGAHAVIMPGVHIGNHAIIATGAVVTKGTRIGDHEVWGGIPAKRINNASPVVQP